MTRRYVYLNVVYLNRQTGGGGCMWRLLKYISVESAAPPEDPERVVTLLYELKAESTAFLIPTINIKTHHKPSLYYDQVST
jgi:hypothetical protein